MAANLYLEHKEDDFAKKFESQNYVKMSTVIQINDVVLKIGLNIFII